ncbi:uncharacterized protein LOC110455484 [Mizuhopecten yessoensis]|uniref:Cyclic nucleotide-binding domain-containing protein 2 n=1 Tax=Mizuhopecten yessoensis TaxID=6573 RepID=A0A210QD21_MIZYE|nr:uncharacterized protein LOC110455484 [Mizuhopecten yessoensis]OWF46626.1 Cyclic nucleotide-binding domain-containing protein 2 [Mizuhopecten yessoensis]
MDNENTTTEKGNPSKPATENDSSAAENVDTIAKEDDINSLKENGSDDEDEFMDDDESTKRSVKKTPEPVASPIMFDETQMDFMNEEWKWPLPKTDEEENDDEEEEDEGNDDDNEEPYIKFRRFARAVKMLISVCQVCQSLLRNNVSQENWFALLDNLNAAAMQQSQKKRKAFVTLVPDENRQLVTLTFDANDYKSNVQSDELLTDDIKEVMKQKPGTRSQHDVEKVVRCIKGICKSFREYPLSIQKEIVQKAFLDTYKHNRVILKKGLPSDGIYFVLRGALIEKPEGRKAPSEIRTGEKFGEEDLVCGCARRGTVITRHEAEIIFLHRFDYMDIFNMSADSNDPKNLEICKKSVVLSHFPMQKLEENPGTWSVRRYKYGRLMVKDSNEIEWIFVIKSGEARVLSHLKPGVINVRKRRKEIQAAMEEESPYHRKTKILNFIAQKDHLKSSYDPALYTPGPRRTLMSAPPVYGHRECMKELAYRDFPATPRPNNYPTMAAFLNAKSQDSMHLKQTSNATTKLPRITLKTPGNSEGPLESNRREMDEVIEDDEQTTKDDESVSRMDNNETPVVLEEIKDISGKTNFYQKTGKDGPLPRPKSEGANKENRLRLARKQFGNAPFIKPRRTRVDSAHERTTELPPFVQVETLHQGQTFGLRSCLDMSDRGPSVSLVSGDCEVLAINKKFFLKHCDDAMFSLIRLKAKPFPTQQELIDRLDITMRWDEYKKETVRDFINFKISRSEKR